jgi:3,4-dihydroxy 2-butanone 4-phosphate synthase/GTP cyclohydrolase II
MISEVKDIINSFKNGDMIILVDDEDRENEGDLIISAEHLTADHINFMITFGKGLVCAPISSNIAKKLKLPLMQGVNNEMQTAYTASVDLKGNGVTTGISADDRYKTIKGLLDKNSTRDDFNVPGHIFPLRSMDGGVLRRAGHTEAAIDLCKLAGHTEVAVICEIINSDGTMARMQDLIDFSNEHKIPIGTIKDLIQYRIDSSNPVEFVSKSKIPTDYGEFIGHVYKDTNDNTEHIALTLGDYLDEKATMVRVHSECLTGDTLFSSKCDCGSQLSNALNTISQNGKGVLLYMRGHEGRGIGLGNKIKAYSLQDSGDDTVDANLKLGFNNDQRDYGTGALILRALGVEKMNLLTNNPQKRAGLEGYGLSIAKRTPLLGETTPENKKYLETKETRMGHNFNEE